MARRIPAQGWLIGFAAALLLVGTAEITTRIIARARAGTWPTTRSVAWHHQVKLLRRIYRSHAYLNTAPQEGGLVSAFGRSVALNSLGYRSPERSGHKPDGVLRILAVGGSTTFDITAPDNAASWPQRVEDRLRATGQTVEVWNAGFPGWTSLESLIALAIRDLDLEPDLILYFHGINDLQPAAHLPFDPQYERGHAEVTRRALGLELEPLSLLERSVLLQELRDFAGTSADPWQALAAPETLAPRRNSISPAGIGAFVRNVRSFAALAQASGAHMILITQPARTRAAHRESDLLYLRGWYPELEPAAISTELERLNLEVRTLAAGGLGDLVDAASGIAWQDEDFSDPLHYSEAGRTRLVDYLAPRIASLLATRLAGAKSPGT